jgi:DNA-directed RNA polymerase subunit RPC12/RpoP
LERALQINPKNQLAKAKLIDLQNTPIDPDYELEDLSHESAAAFDGGDVLKRCPYCGEKIDENAIICKHCGRDFKTKRGELKRRVDHSRTGNMADKEEYQAGQRSTKSPIREPGHQGWNPQCPHCSSFKTGGMGLFGGSIWAWVINIVLIIATSGIWLIAIFIWYIATTIGKDSKTIEYRCRECGYIWKKQRP